MANIVLGNTKVNYTLYRGASWLFNVKVTDSETGDVRKLVIGDLFRLTVRDSDNNVLFDKEFDDFTDNECEVGLTDEETATLTAGKYKYDLWIEWDSGNSDVVIGVSDLVIKEGVKNVG